MKALYPPAPSEGTSRGDAPICPGCPEASTPPQGYASLKAMKLPSGVEVWQPMQVTARLLYATSIVFHVPFLATSEGTRTWVTLSPPIEMPESNVLPTGPVLALVEPDGDQ